MPRLTPNQMYAACVAVEGYLPIPLTREDYLRLLPTAWVGVSEQGIRLHNRTYDHPSRDPEKGLNPFRRTPSDLRGKRKGRWEVRYSPNDLSRVWLRNHTSNEWVEAIWVHSHVVGAPFTQFLWDIAVSQHLERGGRVSEEEAIAHALEALLERAERGPEQARRVLVPDGYTPLPEPAPPREFDPYAGRDPIDWSKVPQSVADPDGDPLGLDDIGLYGGPEGDEGPEIDWEQGAMAPDPALDAWARAGGAEGGAGESLKERYRQIFAQLDQAQDAAGTDGDSNVL
ncbi:hypothetical protein ACWEFL_35735 [Streptomyces sp. NPDC004838]